MAPTAGILVLVDDRALHPAIDRVVAAAGLKVVRAGAPSSRRVWAGAAAILLDGEAALRCVQLGMPRRARVLLVCSEQPGSGEWQAAVAVGAQQLVILPTQERDLLSALTEAADAAGDGVARGPVVAVLAGRGGAGASVFAAALACTATESVLVDGDPWGGGLDLVLGAETEPGLRWPDLALAGGRLSYPALRDALPRRHGVTLLSAGRVLSGSGSSNDIEAGAVSAVIDAGTRAGVPVICDLARRPSAATETALAVADLVILVTTVDVRSCAAAAATARWAEEQNPNTGVVVRGPAPGGLGPADAGRLIGRPVLAAMRPQPGIEAQLDCGGLRLRPRAPLVRAARKVLALVSRRPENGRVSELVA